MTSSTVILAQEIPTQEELKTTLKDKISHEEMTSNDIEKEHEKEDEPLSPYDKLRPKDEPAFMKSIRSWEKRVGFVTPIIWSNAIAIIGFHVFAVVFILVNIAFVDMPMWQTLVFGVVIGQIGGFGVTGGVHRYWCHRSFKAKVPLQIFLLFCYTVAGQNKVFDWVRDHRVHHKFSESDADPHDVRRGLFFSHVGWLMMKKHPEVIRRGNQVDMSDISSDPLIRFHTKHFTLLKLLTCIIVPTMIPLYWGESWWWAVGTQPLLRYILSLNCTWSVNSFAHMFGNKPYDKSILPAENWAVSLAAMGEGWHNYHHTFPWDYKAAEVPYTLNTTTVLLDLFRRVGWAYDAKQASQQLIRNVVAKNGDKEK